MAHKFPVNFTINSCEWVQPAPAHRWTAKFYWEAILLKFK